jgi:hypothetical protein
MVGACAVDGDERRCITAVDHSLYSMARTQTLEFSDKSTMHQKSRGKR